MLPYLRQIERTKHKPASLHGFTTQKYEKKVQKKHDHTVMLLIPI